MHDSNKGLFILNQIHSQKLHGYYLKENLNTVYCIVFRILMDCKLSLSAFVFEK